MTLHTSPPAASQTRRLALRSLMGLIGLCLSAGALAHDDAYLDTQKAPHGGQLRMAGPLHLELVVAKEGPDTQAKPITVYVTDHAGQKRPTAGATGTITLLAGKTKVSTTLTPDGDNRLKGQAAYPALPGLKAVVGVTLAGQTAQQARFTPLAGASGSGSGSGSGEHAEHSRH